jgi:hypothetical protein
MDCGPAFCFWGDTWVDIGDWGVGLDVSSLLANHDGVNRWGLAETELVALTSGVLMTGTTVKIKDFPARVRIALGAGAVHSWDELSREKKRVPAGVLGAGVSPIRYLGAGAGAAWPGAHPPCRGQIIDRGGAHYRYGSSLGIRLESPGIHHGMGLAQLISIGQYLFWTVAPGV